MARTKEGLDYFPLDIDFFDDEKILYVSAKCGLIGELIAIKLLARIYRHGYFIDVDDDHVLLLSKKFGLTEPGQLQSVIDELIKRGFFDKAKYEKYHILTSHGIQKRYVEATKRRKESDVIPKYVCNNGENADTMYTEVPEMPAVDQQSKVKESKVKEMLQYAEYVKMSAEEYQTLCDKYGEAKTKGMIAVLDNYKGSKGKKYKNDYRAILSWVVGKCAAVTLPAYKVRVPEKEAIEFHDDLGAGLAELKKRIR